MEVGHFYRVRSASFTLTTSGFIQDRDLAAVRAVNEADLALTTYNLTRNRLHAWPSDTRRSPNALPLCVTEKSMFNVHKHKCYPLTALRKSTNAQFIDWSTAFRIPQTPVDLVTSRFVDFSFEDHACYVYWSLLPYCHPAYTPASRRCVLESIPHARVSFPQELLFCPV